MGDTLRCISKHRRTSKVSPLDNYFSHLESKTDHQQRHEGGRRDVHHQHRREEYGRFKIVEIQCHRLVDHPSQEDNEWSYEKRDLLLSTLDRQGVYHG